MEQEIRILVTWERRNVPQCAYLVSVGDGGQFNWEADTEFGPFDDAIDVARWASKEVRKLLARPTTL